MLQNNIKVIALIPARKNSKRVPGKNVKKLKGKPLITHTICCAKKSSAIDQIFISTDDPKIKKIAEDYGVKNIKRPKSLARSETQMIDVINHALKKIKSLGIKPKILVLLQPTCPFRRPQDVNQAIALVKKHPKCAVISHIQVDYFHPNRMKKIVNGFIVPYYFKEKKGINRSKLTPAFYRDGSIYAFPILGKPKTWWTKFRTRALILPASRFCNIDTQQDWEVAKALANKYLK